LRRVHELEKRLPETTFLENQNDHTGSLSKT
jgi:hypothetical protein